MKIIFMLLSLNLSAQVLEFDKGNPDDGSFQTYKIENCTQVRADLNICMDGSISFTQPKSTGINGYEGKCGQTAAANIASMLCEEDFSPIAIDKLFKDVTPGVHPRTLIKGLNKIVKSSQNCLSKKTLTLSYAKNESDYIEKIQNAQTPVAILIRNPGGQVLHWVTIINSFESSEGCRFRVNHWGGQFIVPCEIISKWSRGVKDSYGAILKEYTLVI